MTNLRSICVYCGSSDGTDPAMRAAAEGLGRAMGEAGIALVYGGGDHGLMGAVARAVLAAGGSVTGIIPDFLRGKERMIDDAGEKDRRLEMIVVEDMHTRKRMMFERADAFVALPGGVGTLEELVEQLTWVQLERHTKPVLIADVGGFWHPLLALLEHMRENGFINPRTEVRYLVAERVRDILPMLRSAIDSAVRSGRTKETVDSRL
jgi:uncharacterized protein (TIGR00730 family)